MNTIDTLNVFALDQLTELHTRRAELTISNNFFSRMIETHDDIMTHQRYHQIQEEIIKVDNEIHELSSNALIVKKLDDNEK